MAALRLNHESLGPSAGTPVMLVHGFPLDREMWRPVAAMLATKGYRVVLPDLRGHGQSPTMDEVSTMERCARDLFALADELRIRQFWLAGFSVGGYVALRMVDQAPERIQGLLLCDTRAEPDSDEARKKRLDLIRNVETKGTQALVDAMLAPLFSEQTRRQHPELVETAEETIRGTSPQGAIQIIRGMMERPDSRPLLPKIRPPTLIVVGAEDKLTPPEAAMAMQKAIPRSQLRIVTGAAHATPLEAPEALVHFMEDWLRGFTGAAAKAGFAPTANR